MNARKSIIFFPYLPPALGKIDSYLATYLGSNTSPLFVDYVSIYSGVELRFLASWLTWLLLNYAR